MLAIDPTKDLEYLHKTPSIQMLLRRGNVENNLKLRFGSQKMET
jgi:hypothetical protein